MKSKSDSSDLTTTAEDRRLSGSIDGLNRRRDDLRWVFQVASGMSSSKGKQLYLFTTK